MAAEDGALASGHPRGRGVTSERGGKLAILFFKICSGRNLSNLNQDFFVDEITVQHLVELK